MTKPKSKVKPNLSRSKKRTPSEPDVPVRPRLPEPGFHFTEAVGKTIASLTYIDDAPEWQSLEVRFTDGTQFGFDLTPRVQVSAEYLEIRHGDLEIIRRYGVVEDTDPENGEL
jgi:hypothetical protein